MGYIRFNITRTTDSEGNGVNARINRIESDMPSLDTLQPNIIYNALSHKSSVKKWLEMDFGALGRDMLGFAEYLVFDSGVLDCDFIK